ncbi:MAG: Uma2 family endonuclease [Bacteroidia bacterium]
MGQALPHLDFYSPESYFQIDQKGKRKYEYYFGEIVAMAGGNARHSRICMNIQFALSLQLKGRPCEVFNSDVKVEVMPNQMYCYPDASVSCHETELSGDTTLLKQPILLVEVLSPSTALYDLNEKQQAYLQMPSLLYYLVIETRKCNIRVHERQGQTWNLQFYTSKEEVIILPQIDITISVADIYEKVIFSTKK